IERGGQGQVGRTRSLPKRSLPTPVLLGACAAGGPDLDADCCGIAALRANESAQLLEHGECTLLGRISVWHPAVAPLGDPRQGVVVMSAEPHGHATGRWSRVNARVVDRMPASLESDMRLRPELLHHLHLLLGAPATVVEVFVETHELHFI